jgi:hypothetical protein
MNITQVIKILVIIWIRILATDGCIANEYIYIYILGIYLRFSIQFIIMIMIRNMKTKIK